MSARDSEAATAVIRPVDAEAKIVASLAYTNLVATLRGYSNDLGPLHENALRQLLRDLSFMAHGLLKGRRAYPLSCGLGKTQSVIALCAALHARRSSRTVAISASKVEALCQIARHLELHGVPKDAIAITHSYKYDEDRADAARRGEADGYASMPCTPEALAQQCQFRLVSHQRIRNGTPLEGYFYCNGAPRDLLIWDESLIVSDCHTIDHRALQSAFGGVAPWMSPTSGAMQYLKHALDMISEELRRQTEERGVKPLPVRLPEIDEAKIGEFKAELPTNRRVNVTPLKSLLEMSTEPLRVLLTNQDYGIVTHQIVIPKELDSVAILDASYPIRMLENEDENITSDFKPHPKLKLYNNVTIRHMSTGSGRERMTSDFKRSRLMCAEVVKVMKTIPQSEAVILWTFKEGTDKVNFVKVLETALRDAGIDIEAKVDGGKQRLIFRTFGQETSDSDYAYAMHSIFTGVMFRSHFDLASCYIGQKNDRFGVVKQTTIQELVDSEAAHSVFQAICRGSCRMIEGNQAKAHHVWIPVRGRAVLKLLEEVMPGVQIKTWDTEFIAAGKLGKMVSRIEEYLEGLPPLPGRMSITTMKRELGLKPEEKKLFTRALDAFLEQNPDAWERDESKRSIRRTWLELHKDAS